MEQTLKTLAQRIIDEYLDYMEVPGLPDGHMLGSYSDGVWIVDASVTCDMEKMPKLRKVL